MRERRKGGRAGEGPAVLVRRLLRAAFPNSRGAPGVGPGHASGAAPSGDTDGSRGGVAPRRRRPPCLFSPGRLMVGDGDRRRAGRVGGVQRAARGGTGGTRLRLPCGRATTTGSKSLSPQLRAPARPAAPHPHLTTSPSTDRLLAYVDAVSLA
ncbi:hypothetical protein SEVIR_5G352633v4 [Setaria viridis]